MFLTATVTERKRTIESVESTIYIYMLFFVEACQGPKHNHGNEFIRGKRLLYIMYIYTCTIKEGLDWQDS